MFKLLSDRVKKIPPKEVSVDRYQFLKLEEAEPDLGVPTSDNSVISSLIDGTRKWLRFSRGINVLNNDIVVDEKTVPVDSSSLNYSNSDTLAKVLGDFDYNIGKALTGISTDTTITGNGTNTAPLSVIKWATPITLSLSGDLTGQVSFDGSGNANLNASVVSSITSDIVIITKQLTLTTDWQDTGISGTDLQTGSYLVQLFANDIGSGGTNTNEYYTGNMSWYAGPTTSEVELPTDEITLHRAGGGADGSLYLRTYRTNDGFLKLQIYANQPNTSASNYAFKFRRMI